MRENLQILGTKQGVLEAFVYRHALMYLLVNSHSLTWLHVVMTTVPRE